MQKIIDANELTIEGLLNRSAEAYRVPRHQRQFEWAKEQWNDLWEDVHIGRIDESHFLGSIVVIPEGRASVEINYYEVNDGQQRLTTILILLSAIRDRAEELKNDEFAKHIAEHYLTANYFEGGSKKIVPKMTLGKLDNEEFEAVLEGKLQHEAKDGHRIFECYNYFKSEIDRYNLDELENLKKRIVNKIIVVHINVADQFNAFRLFETLNDRGLALSAVDLIKNHLLMRAASTSVGDDAVVDTIVEEWQEMYEKIREYDPVIFFHRFMLSEYSGKISAKQLYEVIKQKANNEKWDAKYIYEFTNKLKKAATIYTELIDANIGNTKINRRLSDIKLFEAGPSYTLLLKITPLFKSGLLDETQYLKVIDLIELFHIRWGITGQSTSRLTEIYNRMCSKIVSAEVGQIANIIESEYLSWASSIKDSMFHSAFQEAFGKPADTRTKFIIWKLGNPAGEISLNFDEVHTEHIMPQTLSDQWFTVLEKSSGLDRDGVKKTHDNLVNKIGNLALIKGEWNISMSNRQFSEKADYYINSEIGSTKELANRTDWVFDDVVDRTKELADKAIQIWKFSKPIPEADLATENLRFRRREYSINSDTKLFCKGPSADATANIVDSNTVRVQKGSRARLEDAPNFKEHNYKKLKDQLVENGILKKDGESLVFTANYDFASASAAAAIVLGRSADGPSEWKDINGKSIYGLSEVSSGTPDNFDEKLEIHITYKKNDIEGIFNTDFGARIKGITLRRDSTGNQYIMLFHVTGSIYKDSGTKEKFIYFGEGVKGDQKLTAANQALIDAINDKRPIYGFWQEGTTDEYEYIGQLRVGNYNYELENDRKVYRFEISKIDSQS